MLERGQKLHNCWVGPAMQYTTAGYMNVETPSREAPEPARAEAEYIFGATISVGPWKSEVLSITMARYLRHILRTWFQATRFPDAAHYICSVISSPASVVSGPFTLSEWDHEGMMAQAPRICASSRSMKDSVSQEQAPRELELLLLTPGTTPSIDILPAEMDRPVWSYSFSTCLPGHSSHKLHEDPFKVPNSGGCSGQANASMECDLSCLAFDMELDDGSKDCSILQQHCAHCGHSVACCRRRDPDRKSSAIRICKPRSDEHFGTYR